MPCGTWAPAQGRVSVCLNLNDSTQVAFPSVSGRKYNKLRMRADVDCQSFCDINLKNCEFVVALRSLSCMMIQQFWPGILITVMC